jgi:DNA-binding beta-propeller fold protein YncE
MKRALILLGLIAVGMSAVPAPSDTVNPYILVSGYNSNNVLKYDAATGSFLGTLIPAGSGGLNAPEGMAVGPDGYLYVSSSDTPSIKRYNLSTGAFVGNFAVGSGLQYPRGITFGPDGNLYVASSNHRILRFNGQTGAFIDTFIPSGTQYIAQPQNLIFRGQYLYISNGDTRCIARYDAQTGQFVDLFSSLQPSGVPQGFKFGSDGNIYTSDSGTNAVRRYDGSTGQFIDTFVPAGSGGLNGTEDVLFNVDGSLLATSFANSRILRYDGTSGAFLNVFASGNGLNSPTYMLLVPEPTAVAGLALGLLLLVRRR